MDAFVAQSITQGIGLLTLNRPDAFNALTLATVKELSARLLELSSDASVMGIVLTGAGKAFSAGGDINRALQHPAGPEAAFHEQATAVHLCIAEIRRTRKPVIAGINGVAAGGGFSLALACDFRIMGRSATLRQAYTSQGLAIGGGATFLLPRLVGLAKAMEIAALDEAIDAERARAWSLATEVVEDAEVVAAALSLARKLAQRSIHSFGVCKELMTNAFDAPFEAHLERERQGFVGCVAHPDGREGLQAFAEKRKPLFNRPPGN